MVAYAFGAMTVCDTCWTAGLQVSAAVLGLLELWEIGAKPSRLLCNT
jgi:hypothetical protein